MSILKTLLDFGSFVELSALVKNADVVCGYGTIEQKLVYIYNQTGYVTQAHAKKIAGVYETAMKVGAPIIGILDSNGMKLTEGLSCLDAYGAIFKAQAKASGVIPQISIINGECMGAAAFIPTLSDFVFMDRKNATFFLQSPNTFAKEVDNSGDIKGKLVHFLFDNEENCIAKVKQLIHYIPSNNLEQAVSQSTDDLNREDPSISQADICQLIASISDNNAYLEIQGEYANTIITCFSKFNGHTTGVIANNGLISGNSLEKAKNFIVFCDAFNIPVLSLSNSPEYNATFIDNINIVYEGGRLIDTLINSSIPKINIILKNAVGSAYLLMNSKHLGADIVYAWKNIEISLIDKTAMEKMTDLETDTSVDAAGELGFLDDIISPPATRKRIIAALEMLQGKRIGEIRKKHSSK